MSSVRFGGNNNAIITLTTPTLTPTTMRTIEEQQSMLDSTPYIDDHEEVGSFIPPLPAVNIVSWTGGSVSTKLDPLEPEINLSKTAKKGTSKKMAKGSKTAGGRRPKMEKNISPQEEERRKQRRIRNKEAAARCRKRRVDHTNKLLDETHDLEGEKNRLQLEVKQLQDEKERLEFALNSHNCTKVLGTTNNNNLNTSNNNPAPKKPQRPTSLPVAVTTSDSLVTPSTGLDMDWSTLPPTGLTPCITPLTPSTTNVLAFMNEDVKPVIKKNSLVQL